MGQVTTGIRSILNHPAVFSFSQQVFGRDKVTRSFVKNFVRPQQDDKILDIGCGPAEIIDYLPKVDYWGFDIHAAYIQQAKAKYGPAGHFACKELRQEDLGTLPKFDIALAFSVLHHLDDSTAFTLLDLARQALKPGGRLVTIDPCFEPGQNPIARRLISWDRGQNVRTRAGYAALLSGLFPSSRIEVHHQAWLPYTRCITESLRP